MDAASAAVSAQMMGAAMAAQAAPAAAAQNGAAESSAEAGISSDKVVTSPLVGTFYTASSPDAEVFVKEGDTVKKGQVLGIIEAMKLMNEIDPRRRRHFHPIYEVQTARRGRPGTPWPRTWTGAAG